MRITFFDHEGKGARLAGALEQAGHELVEHGGDIAVVDHDIRWLCNTHDRVIIYPHGGNPMLDWDGHNAVHPHTCLQLTHSRGHATVLEASGYPVRCEPIGWCYSDLAPLRFPDPPWRILFAPEHASGEGYLAPEIRDRNIRILDQLREHGDVTVRTWRDPGSHGLTAYDDVTWVRGGTLAHDDIDNADVVIAVGTVAHLAAARGVPLIMFGSDMTPDLSCYGGPVHPEHWDACHELIRYPVDFDDADLDTLLKTVTNPDDRVNEWRSRYVEPFDAERAVALIEEVAA